MRAARCFNEFPANCMIAIVAIPFVQRARHNPLPTTGHCNPQFNHGVSLRALRLMYDGRRNSRAVAGSTLLPPLGQLFAIQFETLAAGAISAAPADGHDGSWCFSARPHITCPIARVYHVVFAATPLFKEPENSILLFPFLRQGAALLAARGGRTGRRAARWPLDTRGGRTGAFRARTDFVV